MKKYKILIIGPIPPPYTGMSVVTEEIINSSLKDKFDIIHLDTSDKRAIGRMGKFELTNIVLAFKHFFMFLWLYINKRPDLVYLPIAQNFLGYIRDTLILIPCRILNIKTVVHLNGAYFRKFYETSNIFMKGIIRFTLGRVSAAIVLGECLKSIFKDLIPESRIFVVPNGADDELDNNFVKFSDNNFNVLFLSNLLRTKGVLEVLKVVPDIVSTYYKNIKFKFAGEWESEELKKEATEFVKNNNIHPYVDFVGIVKGITKIKLLNEANLFILPTFYPFEGQPFTILEAMSAYLPVITTKRGAIVETIVDGENGFLVEERNPVQLIEKIVTLISNPNLCNEIGKRNRQVYLERYTKNIFITNLYNVLLETVKTGASAVKAKILFITPLPPPYAGPEVQSRILLNSSLKNDFDLIHLLSNLHSKNKDRGKIDFVSSARFINLIFKMLGVFLLKRPKIVYTHLSQNVTGFSRDSIIILICSAFGKKIILHFHGSNFENFYKNQPNLFRLYISFVLRKTYAFILQAHWVKELFSQLIPKPRLKIIYNPIQIARPFEKEFIDRQSDGIVKVFYMSYISVAKGFSVLVRAIREIIKVNQNIKFLIAGGIINKERNIFYSQDGRRIDFEDIDKLIYVIKNDTILNKYIILLNEITSETEKKFHFDHSDIFVLPSYSEGCPMVILEAMVAGLPVIVTPVGALSEIIEDGKNGFFVKIGDHLDLKEKILLLANNPLLRKEMGNNNRLLIESRLTVDKIIPQFSSFFQNAVEDSFDS